MRSEAGWSPGLGHGRTSSTRHSSISLDVYYEDANLTPPLAVMSDNGAGMLSSTERAATRHEATSYAACASDLSPAS